MRGSSPGGRFNIDFEHDLIETGIRQDLQKTIGTTVRWFTFDDQTSDVDPIYDVGAMDGGRRWKDPFTLQVIWAHIIQSPVVQNDQGFYQSDTMRLTVSVEELNRQIPDMIGHPDRHLLDRIVYRSSVFTPSQVYFRGLTNTNYTILTIDCLEVNPEELVNDPQFNSDTWFLDSSVGQYPVYPVIDTDTLTYLVTVAGGVTYVGEAPVGTPTSSAAWRIKALTLDANDVEESAYPNGDRSFSYVWDNRATYTYASG